MPTTKLQNPLDFEGQKFYIGIDVHKKSWLVSIRSLNLQLERFSQPPSVKILINHLQKKYPRGEYYSAYEAGFSGTGIHEQLCSAGVCNIVTHPADIPSTDKQNKNKSDVRDSRAIAFHLEKGNLHGIHIMSRGSQELRSLFRFRQTKVRDVTRTKNRLKCFLVYFGIRLSEVFEGKEYLSDRALKWLRNLQLASEAGTITLNKLIDDLVYHRSQLLKITLALRKQIQARYHQTYQCLLSVPGIGPVVASALLSEIGDFDRFDSPAEYCSFIGLLPWEHSSGEKIYSKGMQPRCNKHLRPLMVEASWIAIRKEPLLLKYYRKHAARNNKHAIIKVARKLALIARGVALKLQDYQTGYHPQSSGQIKKMSRP